MWRLVLKERQGGSLGDVTQDRTAATATAKGKEELNRCQQRNSRAHHGDVSHEDIECLLADGFFTTERPGKPHTAIFKMYNQQESTV